MSRCSSILLLIGFVGFFGAVATPAQTTLQGRSQYGGLLRNVNSQRCIVSNQFRNVPFLT
jgi:hypothetical protein